MHKLGHICVVFTVIFFWSPKCLVALQIKPLRTMIQVEAGQKSEGSITLVNDKTFPIEVKASVQDDQAGGSIEWLNLGQNTLLIEPKQQKLLNYEVLLPESAKGEYQTRISFLEKKVDTETIAISINSKISVPFFVLARGTEVYDFQIVSFEMDKDSSKEAVVKLRNNGNLHVRPKGNCTIKSLTDDDLVQSARINKTGYPLYPGSKEEFKVEFEEKLPPGKYLAEIQLESATHDVCSIQENFEFGVY